MNVDEDTDTMTRAALGGRPPPDDSLGPFRRDLRRWALQAMYVLWYRPRILARAAHRAEEHRLRGQDVLRTDTDSDFIIVPPSQGERRAGDLQIRTTPRTEISRRRN